MKIDIQKLDDRIKKLQEIRRIAADPELAAILLEFVSPGEAIEERILTPAAKPPEDTSHYAPNTRDMVNDLLNGTGSEVKEGLWSRKK